MYYATDPPPTWMERQTKAWENRGVEKAGRKF